MLETEGEYALVSLLMPCADGFVKSLCREEPGKRSVDAQ